MISESAMLMLTAAETEERIKHTIIRADAAIESAMAKIGMVIRLLRY